LPNHFFGFSAAAKSGVLLELLSVEAAVPAAPRMIAAGTAASKALLMFAL